MILKNKPVRSKKLRDSARGQECTVRVPGVCNYDPDTTVLAHVNGGGMGTKHSDMAGAVSCSACHQWLDYGYLKNSDTYTRDSYHLAGVIETQQRWIDDGLISVKGHAA